MRVMLDNLILQFDEGFGMFLNAFYILLFAILIFYGQRIQFHLSMMEMGGILKQLFFMASHARKTSLDEIKKYSDDPNVEEKMDRLLNSFVIFPESMDPAGIVKKLEHIMNVREARFLEDVRRMITKEIDESRLWNYSNMLEATLVLNLIYKVIEHYYLLAKKTKNFFLMAQLQMIVPLIFNEAKSYLLAIEAFRLGTPIGDTIGPYVVHKLLNDGKTEVIEKKTDYAKDTDLYIAERNNRRIYVIKARGPGGNVGKPGEAIKKVLSRAKKSNEKIAGIIMIDAALKLEGEKTGTVAEGVGAAIGGIGVEKFKIEEAATKYSVPLYAIIIKQSIAEAISTMKKEIVDSTSEVIRRIDRILNNEMEEGSVVIAGIGNTIGVP